MAWVWTGFCFLQLLILHSVVPVLCALWEEIMWVKAVLCFSFSLRLQRFFSSPDTCTGFFYPQLIVTMLWLQLLQSPLSEKVLWAEQEGGASAWGVVFKRHLALGWCTSIKFTSKYLWLLLAVQAVLVIMLSDMTGASNSCACWIWPIQSSEDYFSLLLLKCLKINCGFELLSKVRVWWIHPSLLEAQYRAHRFSSSHIVRRRWRKLCSFLSLFFPIINFNYQIFWRVLMPVARKEDCVWLYVLQRVHRNSLVGEITDPSCSIFSGNFKSASSIFSSVFAFSSFMCEICPNTVEAKKENCFIYKRKCF